MTNSRCIFRVPPRLQLVCEKAYAPQIVSIGPLHHHGKEALKAMEEHKRRYLKYFLGRTNLSLMQYIEKIKNIREAKLRSCYLETIELKSDEFVKIILVDAIFVIHEFLFRYWHPKLLDESDCIFGEPMMTYDIWMDLLVLENQLPFFILEDLFYLDIFPISSEYSNRFDGVERLSIMFLSRCFLADSGIIGGTIAKLETMCCSKEKVQNFVDLL
ncbi:hypothetical protein RchiOBHm_Chr6g0302351 [Rosa chinensis]|uniref:Uncharacterized protein n=1 Tax=Rosa chinensis TaxID=74649 RepID=A0A2P6PZ18_ROSCH|nr:hypothetical protein RchiOBHm_Chr6g0302351 [Rosa chinensis]